MRKRSHVPRFKAKGAPLCCSFVTLHTKINTSPSPAGTKAALFAGSRCDMTALLNCASEAISLQDTSCMASIMYCPKSLLALWPARHYYLNSSRAQALTRPIRPRSAKPPPQKKRHSRLRGRLEGTAPALRRTAVRPRGKCNRERRGDPVRVTLPLPMAVGPFLKKILATSQGRRCQLGLAGKR